MKSEQKPRATSREEELLKEGWSKRFFASGARLLEAVELYESMGLEVHLEPASVQDLSCPECPVEEPADLLSACYVIYTRPGGSKPEDELW